MHWELTRELISAWRRHTIATTKNWLAYSNSHLACESILGTCIPPGVHPEATQDFVVVFVWCLLGTDSLPCVLILKSIRKIPKPKQLTVSALNMKVWGYQVVLFTKEFGVLVGIWKQNKNYTAQCFCTPSAWHSQGSAAQTTLSNNLTLWDNLAFSHPIHLLWSYNCQWKR